MEKSAVAQSGLFKRKRLFVKKAVAKSIKTILIMVLGLCIIQDSCAPSRQYPARESQPKPVRHQLFPNGVYIHQVKIYPKNGKVRKMKVVVSLTPKAVKLIGLSPFNSTLFHLEEDRATGELSVEVYGPFPENIKDEFKNFYKLLREVLLLVINLPNDKTSANFIVKYDKDRFPILIMSKGSESRIHLSQYDENGIPRRLNANHQMFDASVEIQTAH